MIIKSKSSHYFLELEAQEVASTIFYEDKQEVEALVNQFFDIIEQLIEGGEDKDFTVENFLKQRGYESKSN